MPALNFKTQFAPLVESGAKRRTIRAFRKDGRDPKQGEPLYFYTGLRTKYARPITISSNVDVVLMGVNASGVMGYMCQRARHVNIFNDSARFVIHQGGRNLFDDVLNLDRFAQLDGFANWGEMRDWFSETHGLPFNGLLTEW